MKKNFIFITITIFLNIHVYGYKHASEVSEPSGSHLGHDYVDLGLPSQTFWATCNIGSVDTYDYGSYFAWGEIEPKNYFSEENYLYFRGTSYEPGVESKWVCEDIGYSISGTEYDAATQNWGNGWRMPNLDDCYELQTMCWSKWTEENGIYGTRVYGPNNNSIFLPATGLFWLNSATQTNSSGFYWSGYTYPIYDLAVLPIEGSNMASGLCIDLNGVQRDFSLRPIGRAIRPVINKIDVNDVNTMSLSDNIKVEYSDGKLNIIGEIEQIMLVDILGTLVFYDKVADSRIPLPNLSKGIYVVNMIRGKNTFHQKIYIK